MNRRHSVPETVSYIIFYLIWSALTFSHTTVRVSELGLFDQLKSKSII